MLAAAPRAPAEAAMTSTKWKIDNAHTGVHFSVRHMMITNVRGEFQKVEGSVEWDTDKPENSVVEAEIDAASINTREAQRDGHLKSADFLDAEKFPKLVFKSKSVRRVSSDRLSISGDLTIRGTTRPVTLDVEGPSAASKDPFGNVRVGATATTKIKRSDFGMTWNSVIEAGGVLVGDDVSITLDVSLVQAS
jgi:polyisoprenoid-binding protein YceI